jgi:flagellar hook capping protein FlgD
MSMIRNPFRVLACAGLLPALAVMVLGVATRASATDLRESDGGSDPERATSAGSTLWDAIGVSGPNSGFSSDARSLRVVLAPGDRAAFSRRVGMDGARAIQLRFDIRVSGVPEIETAEQTFLLGSEFSASNADEPEGSSFARLTLKATDSGYQLRTAGSGGSGAIFSGTQAITWALNGSGEAVSYAAPDGSAESLGNDRMDVWVGRNKVVDDAAVSTPARAMSDLKWTWSSGSGETLVDQFSIRPLEGDGGSGESGIEAPGTAAATSPASDAAAAGATSIELYRPSPNPFERTTHFAYSVPGPSAAVEIGVFDVAGRHVRSLAHGVQASGRYEVAWDGRADDGLSVNHGVYFLRASVGTSTRVARVVYLFR